MKTSVLSHPSECAEFEPARPRARIIAAARDLFHRHGLRTIGVEVIAEAAGSNKMTLYRHFGSKDELIVACLQEVADEIETMWQTLAARHPGDPLAQLHGWVQEGNRCVLVDGRGCALVNAAIEIADADHPARRLVESFKTAHRNRLAGLCRSAGVADPDLMADSLILLLEGARVSRQSVGADGPCTRFTRAADAMINAFAPQPA